MMERWFNFDQVEPGGLKSRNSYPIILIILITFHQKKKRKWQILNAGNKMDHRVFDDVIRQNLYYTGIILWWSRDKPFTDKSLYLLWRGWLLEKGFRRYRLASFFNRDSQFDMCPTLESLPISYLVYNLLTLRFQKRFLMNYIYLTDRVTRPIFVNNFKIDSD